LRLAFYKFREILFRAKKRVHGYKLKEE